MEWRYTKTVVKRLGPLWARKEVSKNRKEQNNTDPESGKVKTDRALLAWF
jgi:hypothetical protein